VSEPLVIAFEVNASPEHAFAVWTTRCEAWWPADHTLSGDPTSIVFEPHVAGRIYEVAPDGAEHDWGNVVAWEPPGRLAYSWFLFFDPSEATEVEVTFRQVADGRTQVRLEQRGWERLGDQGPPRRTTTGRVWAELTALFGAALQET
jgi:hypothetical protein